MTTSFSPETALLLKERLIDRFNNASYIEKLILLLVLVSIISSLPTKKSPKVHGAPVHGYRSIFEPTLWLQIRFTTGAYHIIESGYNKVCCTFENLAL